MVSLLLLLLAGVSAYPVLFIGSGNTDGRKQAMPSTGGYTNQTVPTSVAAKLKLWWLFRNQQPWELSGLFEGDIMLPRGAGELASRNAMISNIFYWPKAEVPFVISNVFSKQEKTVIEGAINEIQRLTCIRFRPKIQGDQNSIVIGDDPSNQGCWSYVGQRRGDQPVNLLRNGCVFHATVVHELLHSLGLFHQQSASNRDNYIIVHWENIIPADRSEFGMLSAFTVSDFGVSYDYGSVMHYGTHAFSANGKPTMTPRAQGAVIGHATGMSSGDIFKIRSMYNCK